MENYTYTKSEELMLWEGPRLEVSIQREIAQAQKAIDDLKLKLSSYQQRHINLSKLNPTRAAEIALIAPAE